MKFTITFKMPDALDQIPMVNKTDHARAVKYAEKFIEHGEYIDIEFDTSTHEPRVKKVKR